MKRKNRNYWTKNKCLEEAKKYMLKYKFKKDSGGAYIACLRNGWLQEACLHMSISGNKFKRLVYVYEFEDGTIYVGLTYNIEERDSKHKRDQKSPVFKYIKDTNLNPKLTYSQYIDVECAKILEGEKIEFYKKNGYNVLNKANYGATGGSLKWTKEKCIEEALKCATRKSFYKKNNSAYNSARMNNWLDEACLHMNTKEKKHKGYWTKEKCAEEALRYNSKTELYKNSPGAYMSMLNNKWLSELCPHMKTKMSNGYWTKEKCTEEALRYNSKTEFHKNSGGAYRFALNSNFLDDICLHMINKKK